MGVRSRASHLNMPQCKSVKCSKVFICYVFNIVFYSQACAIPDPVTDTVVVTGGDSTYTTVVRYGELGWLEDLPPLLTGRRHHACSSFRHEADGRLVSMSNKYQRGLLSGLIYVKMIFIRLFILLSV